MPPHGCRPPDAVAKEMAMAAMAAAAADGGAAAGPGPSASPCSSGECPGLPRVAAAAERGGERAAGLGTPPPRRCGGVGAGPVGCEG